MTLDPDPLHVQGDDYLRGFRAGVALRPTQLGLFAIGVALGFILGILFWQQSAAATSRPSTDRNSGMSIASPVPSDGLGQSRTGTPQRAGASASGAAVTGVVSAAPTSGTVAPLCSPSPCPTLTPAPWQTHRPRRSVQGTASWFDAPPGQAAAGPGLRQAIGSHWRGRRVTVCASRCIQARLSDWCACSNGKVIDLDDQLFARLEDLSRGLVAVTVSW